MQRFFKMCACTNFRDVVFMERWATDLSRELIADVFEFRSPALREFDSLLDPAQTPGTGPTC
jgi:hypothetical protein